MASVGELETKPRSRVQQYLRCCRCCFETFAALLSGAHRRLGERVAKGERASECAQAGKARVIDFVQKGETINFAYPQGKCML